MRRFAVLASLFLPPLAVAAPITLDPPNPTSGDVLRVTISGLWPDTCVPAKTKITINGDQIEVALTTSGSACRQTLTPWSVRAELGLLGAGRYRLHAVVNADPAVDVGELSFTVTPNLIIRPNAAPSTGGGTVIITSLTEKLSRPPFCYKGFCTNGEMLFGGVNATNLQLVDDYTIQVQAPSHAPGVVDVSMVWQLGGFLFGGFAGSAKSFTYYDPAAPPDDSLFEPILIPLLFNGPGQFGSHWTTEVLVHNDNSVPLVVYRSVTPSEMRANSTTRIVPNASAPPSGFLFRPQRQLAGGVSFSAKIGETSFNADDLGTQLPIAREADFRRGRVNLSNVVVDPRFRTTIRMYAIDPADQFTVWITKVDPVSLSPLLLQLPLPPFTPSKGAGDEPWLVVADLADHQLPPGTYEVEIDSLPGTARLWALASMTNNATQRVTLVSPR